LSMLNWHCVFHYDQKADTITFFSIVVFLRHHGRTTMVSISFDNLSSNTNKTKWHKETNISKEYFNTINI
jgi:hypothetical protein